MRTWQICIFLAIMSITGSVRGEGSGAEALFHEGVRELRAGRYAEAASLFRLSYNLERRAATMCNLALTYERWGRNYDALQSYRQCSADDTTGRFRDHADERASAIQRQLGSQNEPFGLPRAQSQPQPQPQPQPQQPRWTTVPAQQPQPQPQPSQQPSRENHGLAFIGLGFGVLGLGTLGTAIGLNVWASGVYDDINSQYGYEIPEDSAASERIIRGQNGTYAALGLYIGGGLLLGVGILLAILDIAGIRIGSSSRLSLAPQTNGLALSGSFPAF